MALTPFRFTSPSQAVPAGQSLVPSGGPVDLAPSIQQGYTYYKLGVDTTGFPVSDTIDVRVEFTGDNGATFFSGGGFTTTGGPHTNRAGQPFFPFCGSTLPALGPNGLKARVRVTVPRPGNLTFEAELT